MGIEDIIKKHNYTKDISVFLEKAYPELVANIGNEQLVYNALMDCKIVLTDNLYTCLKGYNFLENTKDEGLVSFETLKICSGVYHSEPDIKYNSGLKKYTLEGVNRIVAINASSLNLEIYKAALIHELGHLIKSYNNEWTIKGDTIIERSGLITRIYQLHEKNGVVTKSLWSETGVGLEEGFNAVLEDEVTSKVIGKPYFSNGYKALKEIARLVINLVPGIHEVIKEAQIYHDNTRLDSKLGQTFYDLQEITDTIYPMIVKMSDMNTPKYERHKISENVIKILNDRFKIIIDELKSVGQGSIEY